MSLLRRRLLMRLAPGSVVRVPVWAYALGSLVSAAVAALWVYAEVLGGDWIATGIGVIIAAAFIGAVLLFGFSESGR